MFEDMNIMLASGSPRRKKLLEEAELPFTVKVSQIEENYPSDLPKVLVPEFLATKKAEAVLKDTSEDALIIGADTVVLLGNKILEKPQDEQEAIHTLKQLSGAFHQVITGVCLLYKGKKSTFATSTFVYFKKLSEAVIHHYVEQYQPLDKAGSYGIQEWIGLVGIDRIEGDYFNVVGLPVSRVLAEVGKLKNVE